MNFIFYIYLYNTLQIRNKKAILQSIFFLYTCTRDYKVTKRDYKTSGVKTNGLGYTVTQKNGLDSKSITIGKQIVTFESGATNTS